MSAGEGNRADRRAAARAARRGGAAIGTPGHGLGDTVVVGWVHPGHVHYPFMDSVLRTVAYDRHAGGSRIVGWNGVQCSANVSSGRNALVEWFLAETTAEWLVQIDTDMLWEADAVHRLLAAADPVGAPIVGALCFGKEPDTGRLFPTMYELRGETAESVEFVRYDTWAPDAMFPVVATGAAFLLTHRSALQKVAATTPSRVYPWFQETELAGKKVGEDVTFCLRAVRAGLPVYVHTGVSIGHIKEHVAALPGYLAQLRADHENRPAESDSAATTDPAEGEGMQQS